MKTPIEIFFVCDNNFAPFMAATALSVIENTCEQVNFHVLTENFKEEDKKIINDFLCLNRKNVSIEFIDVSEKLKVFEGANKANFKSYIPFARFFIPEISNVSKALYLDVDIIVDTDIKEIWNNVDFQNNNKTIAAFGVGEEQKKHFDEISRLLKLHSMHRHFCSGVLLIDCDRWRKENVIEKLIDISHKANKSQYADQAVLNIYFDNNQYIDIDRRFITYPINAETKKKSKYYIIHYAGTKPWKNLDVLLSDKFWFYARKTPYYREILYPIKKNLIKQKIKRRIKNILPQFAINFIKKLRSNVHDSYYNLWKQTYSPKGKLPWDENEPEPWIMELHKQGKIGGKVLDIGCGPGRNTLYLVQQGYNVTAADISDIAINRVKEKIRENDGKAKLICADMSKKTLRSNYFDTIFDIGCYHSMEGKKRKQYVTNLHKMCRNRGVLYLRAHHITHYDGQNIDCIAHEDITNDFLPPKWQIENIFEKKVPMLTKMPDSNADAWFVEIKCRK